MADNLAPDPGGEQKSAGAQGIGTLIERTFLVGVGAAAFTKDRIQSSGRRVCASRPAHRRRGSRHGGQLVTPQQDRGPVRHEEGGLVPAGHLPGFGARHRPGARGRGFPVRQLEHRIRLLEARCRHSETRPKLVLVSRSSGSRYCCKCRGMAVKSTQGVHLATSRSGNPVS